jgi:hypothetical protein
MGGHGHHEAECMGAGGGGGWGKQTFSATEGRQPPGTQSILCRMVARCHSVRRPLRDVHGCVCVMPAACAALLLHVCVRESERESDE